MSLVMSGPLVIQSSGSAQQPQVDTFGSLKECAASIVNGKNQPKILQMAGKGIQRAIKDVNLRHLMRFGSKQASAADLVSGTNTYSLAADFFAVRSVQLINSDSKPVRSLDYVPWDVWNKLVEKQTDSGTPLKWTAKNSFDDSQIIVWPTPGDSDATDYDILITYYERITEPSVDSDIIDAPKDFSEVLCTYAEWFLLDHRKGTQRVRVDRKYGEYRDKLNAFVRADGRHEEQGLQFRIAYEDDPLTVQIDPNTFW